MYILGVIKIINEKRFKMSLNYRQLKKNVMH